MGLFDRLNELIIEHGSSVVQEKHIALFRDQLINAEKATVELESQLKNAKSKIQELTEIIEEKNNKIANYEKDIHKRPLEEIEISILKYISEEPKTAKEISISLSTGEETIKFHLEKLETKNMVESAHVPFGVGDIWSLKQDGREYLIQNNLIK